ncbi:putative ELL-associated factor [Zostera marina]|uniref:Putative ELL-associated factor n=1 Tax=Zostera marina TaxID=29655 RepID=A0A0K9PUH7_ZOSMR|nr:putative ELL-associated factor [Zostera marina]
MANCNNNSEPSSAPISGIWYNLTLGSSYKENPATKFCTLRYEFKPASIDKSQAGALHKNKENRVSLEFQNNQHGKPNVVFEGSSEDYKKNDGVLFFNGDSFRLERLHRSVKRLRHVRMPGESAAASSSLNPAANSPPLGKISKPSHSSPKTFVPAVPVLIEKIDIGESDSPAAKPTGRTTENPPSFPLKVESPSTRKKKNSEHSEQEDHYSLIFGDDDKFDNEEIEIPISDKKDAEKQGPDMNIIPNNDSDDEIADVDVNDDVEGNGLNAAEALRAQVNAEEQQQTSSSSGSGSSSSDSDSGSGSGSSSSESEASDDDTASSAGDVDI